VEATELDALRKSSRISRKDRIRNITIRQQIGLKEIIKKEIEQNQLIRNSLPKSRTFLLGHPVYTFIYVFTQQYSTIVSNYNFYLVRGDMFRLLIQPSAGQLKLACRWLFEQPKHVVTH